ncbi:MAG TPA: 6-hydroxymethylpterin diphosphokinase MptE-like protein [Rhizomicrobium sp.]|nr:6-hydroxymethylpterin diphosphokinase MptE-like protein [Rhizomicrobium sp.]
MISRLKFFRRVAKKRPSGADAPDCLTKFKNIHNGRRCFVMGNGPSLAKMDLSKLENDIVFGCNNIFLLFDRIAWRPTYYACVDSRVLPDRASDIDRMLRENPAIKAAFFPCIVEEHFGEKRHYGARTILPPAPGRFFFHEVQSSLKFLPDSMFSVNADRYVVQPFTVAITMLQLAAYMGFSEIYLIGCDTSYRVPETVTSDASGGALVSTADDDPNHFDPHYFGKGRKWHDPRPEKMIEHYEHAKVALSRTGIKVFNATAGGALEVFPRVEFDSLFQDVPRRVSA